MKTYEVTFLEITERKTTVTAESENDALRYIEAKNSNGATINNYSSRAIWTNVLATKAKFKS